MPSPPLWCSLDVIRSQSTSQTANGMGSSETEMLARRREMEDAAIMTEDADEATASPEVLIVLYLFIDGGIWPKQIGDNSWREK